MEVEKESKDLKDQHSKAESQVFYHPKPIQVHIKALLDLQNSRNALYLQYVSELSALESHYSAAYSCLYVERASLLFPLPDFWFRAIKNSPTCSALLYPIDEPVLFFLSDIRSLSDPSSDNFCLEFAFKENPYFENKVLRKAYLMSSSDVMEKAIGTEIQWKEEPISLEPSFFRFFNSVTMPTVEQLSGLDAPTEQELLENVEQDFDIASEFRDELIPNAVFYYLNVRAEPRLNMA
jgi:hypothetical protein